jgi:hypothetical protein
MSPVPGAENISPVYNVTSNYTSHSNRQSPRDAVIVTGQLHITPSTTTRDAHGVVPQNIY